MNRIYTFIVFLILAAPNSFAGVKYVATDGNDNNPGTFNQPYKTFDKATSQIYAGDTLYIRGGRYSQVLDFARGGTSGNPIVVLAYPGEKVVITALEPLSGWELDEGSVYKTNVGWNLGQENFVMHGDTACDLARWPNNDDGNPFTLNSLRNSGGSPGGTIYNAFLDYNTGIPDFDWSKGGSVFFYCDKGGAGWIAWKCFIKSNTSTRLTFDLIKSPDWIRTVHAPADLGDFYLEGIREVLDYENEWFFDEENGVLYLQLPEGAEPADSAVYMKKRTYTMRLNTDYLVVKNIDVFGGSIEITGNYNHLYGIKSRWGNHHRGILDKGFATPIQSVLIKGTRNTVEKCDVGYGAGTGVKVSGTYNRVLNSYIHNFNFLGSYDAPLMARDGLRTTVSQSTITRGGRDAVHMSNNHSVLQYSDVSHSNLIADDCALFYVVGGPHYITIHHNWFHDTRSRGNLRKAAGIYLDNDPEAFIVHHNVVWNTEWANIQMNKDARDIDVYNNTFLTGSTAMGAWHKEGTSFEGVKVYNNLADNTGFESQADRQNNLTFSSDPFVNKEAKNFQLKPGTAPIDFGRTIRGYTDGFVGSAPDAGAYEYGQPMWKAGIDWDPELGPDACIESDVYEEVNGIVVVEAESASIVGNGWEISDSLPSHGSAYLKYKGPDETAEVVDSTISTWKIKISTPGNYRFLWRSRSGTSATGLDQQNSSWLNIECDEFLGVASDTAYEIGTSYAKVSVNDTNNWTWQSNAEYNGTNSLKIKANFRYSGIYEIQIAGRSSGHLIDRLTLFQEGRESLATDSSTNESWTGCDKYTVQNQWATPKQADIIKNKVEFVIDGTTDSAWSGQPEMIGSFSVQDGAFPVESDLSYTCRISANDSALFLLALIKDDVLSEDDNLMLFLNPDNNHLPIGLYGKNTLSIRFVYSKQDTLILGNGTWKAENQEGFKYITADTTGGYILEARIPWKGIFPFEVDKAESRYLGFEIQVNDIDNDPDVENKVAWANNTGIDLSMYDTRKFGVLSLTGEPDPPVKVTGVSIIADTLIFYPGQIEILTADVEPVDAANKTVTWDALDATVVNLAPSTGIAKGLYVGTTKIIVTTQDGGFTDTLIFIVRDPTSVPDNEDPKWTNPARREISLVPNPANRSFWIKGINHWTQLQVYSITGELMMNRNRMGDKENVDIRHLPAGLYLVRIYDNKEVYFRKLIKSDLLK